MKKNIYVVVWMLVIVSISLLVCVHLLLYQEVKSQDVTSEVVVNGINIYGDANNLSRLIYLMNELEVTKNKYPNIEKISYYQKSVSCNGRYTFPSSIKLWRCDKSLEIRNSSISEEFVEHFILLHELGHSVYRDMPEFFYDEYFIDEYAKKELLSYKIKKGFLR